MCRSGDEHLARRRGGEHACGEMHGDSANLTRGALDLAGVDSRTDLEPEGTHGVTDGERRAYGARRAVEQREEAVTRGVDLVARESAELESYGSVMLCEQVCPRASPSSPHHLRRAHDVGEQERGEDAVYPPEWAGLP